MKCYKFSYLACLCVSSDGCGFAVTDSSRSVFWKRNTNAGAQTENTTPSTITVIYHMKTSDPSDVCVCVCECVCEQRLCCVVSPSRSCLQLSHSRGATGIFQGGVITFNTLRFSRGQAHEQD